MKPDIEQLQKILDVIESNPKSDMGVRDLQNLVQISDDAFLFYIRLLEDQHLVEGSSTVRPLYALTGRHSDVLTWGSPLRLTAHGHSFVANLRAPTVLPTIKEKLVESSLAIWVQAAAAVASAYALKQLGLAS